jgi:hypothetical protein
MAEITLAAAVRISLHPDGAIAFDTRNGHIFSANAVGARILTLLSERQPIEEVATVIGREFDAPPEMVRADMRRFVDNLRTRGLLCA